jgi:ABC-2 type transport system ATP-binding protein
LRDLSFTYRRAPVIVGVRWEIPSHCVSAVLGLSGAGKSTLLSLIAGAQDPSGGSITLDGRDPRKTATRRLIGYMPELAGLYGDLSVEENLQVFGAGMGASAKAIDQALDVVQLGLRRHELVRELSAGYQARVSLGVALLGSPPFLLLDEPFAHLDNELTTRLWAYLRDHAARGNTVVVATGNPQVAAQTHLIGVIRGGRLLSTTAVDNLRPGGRATVVLHYREKTGPRKEEFVLDNYKQELLGLVAAATVKPFEIEVRQETLESRLESLMKEDAHAAAHRA